MLRGSSCHRALDEERALFLAWTTSGPVVRNRLPMSTTNHIAQATAKPNIQEGVTAVKGIDKRLNSDGSVSYRARVGIKSSVT